MDAIKGQAGPIANQIVGTVSGIARFYRQTDDILGAIPRGTAASSAEGWDFVVARLTEKLPIMSRHALQFLNNVLSKKVKELMFQNMMAEYEASRSHDVKFTK